MSSPYLYISNNPVTNHQAHFVLHGFQDRGWYFCVKSSTHKKPSMVASLDLNILGITRHFKGAEWSMDGQIIAVRLDTIVRSYTGPDELRGGPDSQYISSSENSNIWGYAYDFTRDIPILPSNNEWQSNHSNILALVASHGGFSGNYVTSEEMRQQCIPIKVRQIPK